MIDRSAATFLAVLLLTTITAIQTRRVNRLVINYASAPPPRDELARKIAISIAVQWMAVLFTILACLLGLVDSIGG